LVQQAQTAFGLSQRRVCKALGFDRSSVRYHPSPLKREQDRTLSECLRQLAQEHPRFGYRRMQAMLKRQSQSQSQSQSHNHKRVQRLWRKAGLSLPRRRPRKRRHSGQRALVVEPATRPNQRWCYDFVFDRCANGSQLKMLTVEDEFTRESLALEVGGSLPAVRVIAVLERLIAERGLPDELRSDNGPEFIAQAIQQWLQKQGVKTIYIEPGKPWQNGLAESFNGKLRDECLSREWFKNRAEAVAVVARFRRYYNEERPHSSLDYQTPTEFRLKYEAQQKASKTNKD
jgi:putative transposase